MVKLTQLEFMSSRYQCNHAVRYVNQRYQVYGYAPREVGLNSRITFQHFRVRLVPY